MRLLISVMIFQFIFPVFSDLGAQEASPSWRKYISFSGGPHIANKEIGKGINAGGGEKMIAKIRHGAIMNIKVGIYKQWVGFEVGLYAGLRQIKVVGANGADFKNHGNIPLLGSAEILIFPFKDFILNGTVMPFFLAGAGDSILRVDLDNVYDQEWYHRLTRILGGGIRYSLKGGADSFLLFEIKYLSMNPITISNNVNSLLLSVGVFSFL